MKLNFKKNLTNIDWLLYVLPIILSIFGIVIIFSLTYNTSVNLIISQCAYLIFGLIIAYLLSNLDYRTIKGLYLVLYLIGLLLLILVIFFGTTTFGATRWINLYIFQLQPSEIFKVIIIIVLAKLYSDWEYVDLKRFLLSLLFVTIPTALIILQPDLGTASVIIVGFLTILFISSIKKIYLIIGLIILILLSPIGWHFLRPYQKDRITSFTNPAADPYGTGYNVAQAKIAVGSGGLFGQGLGKGSQSQLNFLPVAHSDFIFAGTAEATGFVGSSLLIIIFMFLVARIFYISKLSKDNFGMFFSISIGMIFLFQALVNIGMNLGIMPVTGIPLPFISAGGSSMLTSFAAIGILQSIYIRHKKIAF